MSTETVIHLARRMAEDRRGDNVATLDADIVKMVLDHSAPDIPGEGRFAPRLPIVDVLNQVVRRRIELIGEEFHRVSDGKYRAAVKNKAFEGLHDFSHTAPDLRNLLQLGLTGLLARLEEGLARPMITAAQRAYFEAGAKVYRAAIDYVRRMADKAAAHGRTEMADGLRALSERPPRTFFEALQLILVYYDFQQFVDCTPLRSLGRLDTLLYPYYRDDLAAGRLVEETAETMFRDFLRHLDSFRVAANAPFSIAGVHSNGTTFVNELSYLFLRCLVAEKLPNVKLHIFYGREIPKDLAAMAFEGIRAGGNSIVFINEKVSRHALLSIGISPEDAENYVVVGCYEPCAIAELPCTCNGYLNLAKAVEVTLTGGFDLENGTEIGFIREAAFATFDDFFAAFLRQLDFFVCGIMEMTDSKERLYPVIRSSPFFSATQNSCIEKGGDAYRDCAIKYSNSSINAFGIATAVDSLLAVKKLVFDDQALALPELVAILKENWAGHDVLRNRIRNTFPKYGIGDPGADALARAVIEHLASRINGHHNAKNGVYRLGAFSIDWCYAWGKETRASADGRLSGEPLSKNLGATIGCDRSGPTGQMISAARLGGGVIPNGAVLDIALHAGASAGEEWGPNMIASLNSFMEMGGMSIHYNVLNGDILRDARLHPDAYPNLQVRVCGWNALFSMLSRREQDDFIRLAEDPS